MRACEQIGCMRADRAGRCCCSARGMRTWVAHALHVPREGAALRPTRLPRGTVHARVLCDDALAPPADESSCCTWLRTIVRIAAGCGWAATAGAVNPAHACAAAQAARGARRQRWRPVARAAILSGVYCELAAPRRNIDLHPVCARACDTSVSAVPRTGSAGSRAH